MNLLLQIGRTQRTALGLRPRRGGAIQRSPSAPQQWIAIALIASVLVAREAVPVRGAEDHGIDRDITAPKLDAIDRAPDTEQAAPADNPHRLPQTVTICQDQKAKRCWSEPGASPCDAAAAPAVRTFRQLAADGSAGDPGMALKACWDELRQ